MTVGVGVGSGSPGLHAVSAPTTAMTANTRGARWNPPGLAAIYTSEERDTAIAEGQHAIDMQPLRRAIVNTCGSAVSGCGLDGRRGGVLIF